MPLPAVLLDGESFDLDHAGVSHWVHEARVTSTMDVAHAAAEAGAPSGTVVLADQQDLGRGRSGKTWASAAHRGLWFTLVERDVSGDALDVLSLRIGLALAGVLGPWCDGVLALKWPNDLLLASGAALGTVPASVPRTALAKLAGVLVEARWRAGRAEWVAIGVGINRAIPDAVLPDVRAAAVRRGVSRRAMLAALVPVLRAAVERTGPLDPAELARWRQYDAMRGRACVAPERGMVDGLDADGALRVVLPDGRVARHRSGSLILVEE
jgi:BirA family transcriptional regulator, biotin operon repressor / biotin---[acetyl-CoA-carboxylase] ligase